MTNLTAEQERLLTVMKQHNGKCTMTFIRGAGFHQKTISALKDKGLLQEAFMGGWYLLPELAHNNKEV